MSGLVEGILGQLGSKGVGEIAKSLGVDDNLAGAAVKMALPAILGGMANNSRETSGAESLASALSDHNPSIFDNLGALLGDSSDGAKILGHVLGGRQPKVAENLAGQSGLDMGLIMQLLPILAPLVMGYLSKQKQDQGLDAGGLGGLLTSERQQSEQAQPGLGGLASILDDLLG